MTTELSGRTALVTGASRGIGRATALMLSGMGARVVGTATTEEGAAAISDYLGEAGNDGTGLVLDIADAGSIAGLAAVLRERDMIPLILVNNAGITRDNLMLRMKDEEWDVVINTNLNSVFRMCKQFLRDMVKARFGRIINISSVVALSGNPGQANYTAAKAGIIGFTRSLARELGSRNITVNTVAPGFIETDMTGALTEEQRQVMLEQIALGRLGSVQDIAGAVAFLASPAADYITGETLNVNGGMYMA